MTATELHPVLQGSPYRAYVYAYPHKTAYRRLDPMRPLREVWADEPRGGLFLYLHVPFCTMRCGFCNLFTTPNPKNGIVAHYLSALRRQAEAVKNAIPDAKFARVSVGGGTPTFLDETGLTTVLDSAEELMGAELHTIPVGIETSPDTLTPAKVQLLVARGVDRISIGIQSYIEAETAGCGRPQSRTDVDTALSLLADAAFPTLNIDLIYGLPGQSVETWLSSLQQALRYSPEELYLYPLYVRPLTGLGRSHKEWDDTRLACYRAGRELLLGEGYEQVSMRMFRRDRKIKTPSPGTHRNAMCSDLSPAGRGACGWPSPTAFQDDRSPRPLPAGERSPHDAIASKAGEGVLSRFTPVYCCQEDGMVGLGCGARSYTRGLHYSLDYAVGPKDVKAIIADYLTRTADELAVADHGFVLDADEQRRRYLLQSLPNVEGLDVNRYAERFGTDPADDFPDLHTFAELGLLTQEASRWLPTPLGLERSDALGPWFFSAKVNGLMAGYAAR